MDAQTTVRETAAITALVQCIVRHAVEADLIDEPIPQEVLDENRFLAARDGMHSDLIDFEKGERVPAKVLLDELLKQSGPSAAELGCADELSGVEALAAQTGAERQRAQGRSLGSLPPLVESIAGDFLTGT